MSVVMPAFCLVAHVTCGLVAPHTRYTQNWFDYKQDKSFEFVCITTDTDEDAWFRFKLEEATPTKPPGVELGPGLEMCTAPSTS